MDTISKSLKKINNASFGSEVHSINTKNSNKLIEIMDNNLNFQDIEGYEDIKKDFRKLGKILKYNNGEKIIRSFLISGNSPENKSKLIKSILNILSKVSGKKIIGIQMNIDEFYNNTSKEVEGIIKNISKLFQLLRKTYNKNIILYINNIEKLGLLFNSYEGNNIPMNRRISETLLFELLENWSRNFIVIGQMDDLSKLDCCLSSKFCHKYNFGNSEISGFRNISKYEKPIDIENIEKD